MKKLIVLGVLVLTVVAGVRLRKTVSDILGPDQGINHIVISAYANAYCSYTTTHQEYSMQNYEGASTLFGPWTLMAFQKENRKLAEASKDGTDVINEVKPEIIPVEKLKVFKENREPLDYEFPRFGRHFGDFLINPEDTYQN